MWHCVTGGGVPDISKNRGAFSFKKNQSSLSVITSFMKYCPEGSKYPIGILQLAVNYIFSFNYEYMNYDRRIMHVDALHIDPNNTHLNFPPSDVFF
jgi:hypothetical protein